MPPIRMSGTPRLLLWSSDGFMALYGIDGRQIAAAADILADLNGVSLSPGGERIAGYSAGGAAAHLAAAGLEHGCHAAQRRQRLYGRLADPSGLARRQHLALYDENGLLQVAQPLWIRPAASP